MEISKLGEASSVTIVVHGIGDHSSSDILGSARQGYRSLEADEGKVEDVSFHGFPQPDGTDGLQQARQIVSNARIHFVVPIVWSDLRVRASHAFRVPFFGFQNLIQAINQSIASIAHNWLDIASCAIKSKTPIWMTSILLLDVAIIALTLVFWFGAMSLIFLIGTYLHGRGHIDIHWYYSVLLVLSAVFLQYILKRLVPLFDFVGDVASYVARQVSRLEHEAALARIVEVVSRQAPNARILLVGHSLGSVLVTHALLKANILPSANRRVTLITLGSPLKLMNRVFPKLIRSPDEISRGCEGSTSVLFWVNLWRDCDYIGRELAPTQQAVFAETSLGNGPHWNMWSDKRLWSAMVKLLQVKDMAAFDGVKLSWDMGSSIVWPENRKEVYGAGFRLWFRRLFVTPMIFMGAILFAYGGYGGRWFGYCQPDALLSVWFVWVVIEVLAIALFYASIMPADSVQYLNNTGTQFSRRFLGELRRTKAASNTVSNMLSITILAFPAILSWAMAS